MKCRITIGTVENGKPSGDEFIVHSDCFAGSRLESFSKQPMRAKEGSKKGGHVDVKLSVDLRTWGFTLHVRERAKGSARRFAYPIPVRGELDALATGERDFIVDYGPKTAVRVPAEIIELLRREIDNDTMVIAAKQFLLERAAKGLSLPKVVRAEDLCSYSKKSATFS